MNSYEQIQLQTGLQSHSSQNMNASPPTTKSDPLLLQHDEWQLQKFSSLLQYEKPSHLTTAVQTVANYDTKSR